MAQHSEFAAVIERLAQTIEARKSASASDSYTASLLQAGPEKCAKKFGEEAVELVLAAAGETTERTASEAADVLYHFLVLLAARDVPLAAVTAALQKRQSQSGHAEKASRQS